MYTEELEVDCPVCGEETVKIIIIHKIGGDVVTSDDQCYCGATSSKIEKAFNVKRGGGVKVERSYLKLGMKDRKENKDSG